MDRAYIGISLPNIVSVTIMATVGIVLLGAISATIKNYRNG